MKKNIFTALMLLLPFWGLTQKLIIGIWSMHHYTVIFNSNHRYEVIEKSFLFHCFKCEGIGYRKCSFCSLSKEHGCRSCKYSGRVECTTCHGTGRLPDIKIESGAWSYSQGILKVKQDPIFLSHGSYQPTPPVTRKHKLIWTKDNTLFSFTDKKGKHTLVRYNYLDYRF